MRRTLQSQQVFAAQGHSPQCAFCGVFVHLDAPIVAEATERFTARQRTMDRRGEIGLPEELPQR
jgi:hypothetical protein